MLSVPFNAQVLVTALTFMLWPNGIALKADSFYFVCQQISRLTYLTVLLFIEAFNSRGYRCLEKWTFLMA